MLAARLLPGVAVITAVVLVVTDVVVTVNEALVLPAVTVAQPGALADPLLLESDTTVSRPGSMSLGTTFEPSTPALRFTAATPPEFEVAVRFASLMAV